MNRKYIGIEMGEHVYTHCKVRLDKIISGEDKGGITKNVNLLDVGGIGVAIYETITSVKYRKKVKREFIIGRYDEIFEGL